MSLEPAEYLGCDRDQVVVEGAQTLSSEGWNLIVLVTNRRVEPPYTEEIEIDLTVESSTGSGINFPITYEAQGPYKGIYHIVYGEKVDFTCESTSTDYWITLNADGTASMRYNRNKKLDSHSDGTHECVEGAVNVYVPADGSHDFTGTFTFSGGNESGCDTLVGEITGSFSEDGISGGGEYYMCSYGEHTETHVLGKFASAPVD